jgi:hypothetical protein
VRPARRADNSAVIVVPNVKVKMEAQNSIPPLSLHDLLPEALPSPFTKNQCSTLHSAWDSSAGGLTGLTLDEGRIGIRSQGNRILPSPKCPEQPAAHPASYSVGT